MGLENVPRCQHIKANGTQCGSPALRRRRLCFFHRRCQEQKERLIADKFAQRQFEVPVLEDANAVQLALMQVMQELAWGRMDHKTAGLLLYALQTASVNLRNIRLDVVDPTEVVIDRDTVRSTSIDGPQWVEEDFDEEQEEEENEEASAEAAQDDEEAAEEDAGEKVPVAEPVAAAAHAKEAATVKKPRPPVSANVNLDEVRENVKNLARNWILETLDGQTSRELG